jgi:hypothetical protein
VAIRESFAFDASKRFTPSIQQWQNAPLATVATTWHNGMMHARRGRKRGGEYAIK